MGGGICRCSLPCCSCRCGNRPQTRFCQCGPYLSRIGSGAKYPNKLDTEFAPRQQQLEKLQNEIEVSAQKAEKLKAGKARAAAMAELERQRREFRGSQAQLAEEYDLRRNEEFAALQNNANRVILELAKKEGYDLIVHDVIFIDAKFDITDKVIREMNR